MTQTISPADLAMDEFRSFFKYTMKCFVTEDGYQMRYRVSTTNHSVNKELLLEAEAIIEQNDLPLKASLEVCSMKDVVFEINLCIDFLNPIS